MEIVSLNVSLPREIEVGGQKVRTGIFKEPVDKRLMLHQLNFDGDGQADLMAHGGIYKAVYGYPYEHYATWQSELERDDFTYGQFGENLTTRGLLENEIYVGNVYRIGDAVLQITQPRVPCYKLAIRMNDAKFVKKFMKAERTGFYFRVIEEGEVGAGDSITLLEEDPQQMTVQAINHLLYFEQVSQLAEKALKIDALSPGWKDSFMKMVG